MECGSLLDVQKRFRGTMVIYEWTCINNHVGRWESQPLVRGMPQGNLDLSGSILFSGGTYTKVLDMANVLNLNILTERHYLNIQRPLLFPVVESLYQEQHQLLLSSFRSKHVFLGGDGRSDSPGHNAKYLSYSFVDEESDKILHFELVQVTEAPGQASTNMERLAFNRGMQYLQDENVIVDGIATDRHPQIASDMDKNTKNCHMNLTFSMWQRTLTKS
ncbi:uncharacterized protein LOC117118691 [Anneissia japonica]|uniref:uncharacterized protein LOC117118691 n=1 Tax=Anneissia japonica TaxID=1529436 RepID=UPI001425A324|nr:uncharacterized protein LOC117118691 [Anneissia japonica]